MYRIPNRIFVGGIPQTALQNELRDYFSHFGNVKDARIITDPRGNSRGYGFVTYENENDALKVLSLKEEDLIFKENRLNIGHAFRKKNNFMGQPSNPHHHSNNFHHQNQFNNSMNMSAQPIQMNNHSISNYLDGQMGNMHQIPNGMGSNFGQAPMNLSQMNNHMGINSINNFNHMSGFNGVNMN
ncbi:boule [Brachionus plicatilis]|uniref:Boule n=1 Tax=Brachionus plicatilis TaxID=10195 RepID=A0A3M7S1M1_BRAPC|nr:boule [Brachionus plicatilis]